MHPHVTIATVQREPWTWQTTLKLVGDEPTPERFWKVRPFQSTDVKKIEEVLVNLVTGADEGAALVAEHEGINVALLVAQQQPAFGTIRLVDLRVDYDHRRDGIKFARRFIVQD